MKSVHLLVCALTLAVSASAKAQEITTAAEAQDFLDDYCVALVNEISKAVDRQKGHAEREEWDKFMEQGAWIAGVSDVYGNLCKD
ncbi:MAG: hypothetical protein AAGC91_08540 [Pseudomonadota bacterium]